MVKTNFKIYSKYETILKYMTKIKCVLWKQKQNFDHKNICIVVGKHVIIFREKCSFGSRIWV